MRMIAAALGLLALSATAAPFDYLLITEDLPTLLADPVAGPLISSNGQLRQDICIPNVQRWNTLQDVTTNDGLTAHTFMPDYAVICSFSARQAPLDAASLTFLITDRGAAQAGVPFVVQSALPMDSLQTMMLQPVPSGANYIFLNAQLITKE